MRDFTPLLQLKEIADFVGLVLSHLHVIPFDDHYQGESPPEGEPAGELSPNAVPFS